MINLFKLPWRKASFYKQWEDDKRFVIAYPLPLFIRRLAPMRSINERRLANGREIHQGEAFVRDARPYFL